MSASKQWKKLFNLDPEKELDGVDLWSLFNEVDLTTQTYFSDKISKNKPFDLVFSLVFEGEARSAQVQCYPVDSNRPELGFISVWMLLGHSRASQLKINEILSSISDRLEEGFYRTTLSGEVIYMNEAMSQMLGYDPSANPRMLNAKNFYADPKRREELMLELAEKNRFTNQEVLLKRTNGEIFWGLLSTTQSHLENGEVVLDGSVRDISRIKEIEKQLIVEMKRAEGASLAKQQFLSVISHELKTPLNGVIGLCHLLQGSEPRPDQKDHLDALQFSAENLLNLINDVLDFSKVEASRIQLNREWFDLRELLEKTVELFDRQPMKKAISLELTVSDEVPQKVYLDYFRLTQILNNLLSNALKFTFHGSVKLSVDLLEVNADRCQLRFTVADTGIGIPKSKLNTIFQLFTQGSSNTTRKFGGTGLGLSITKGLVELFESELLVESEIGEGTSFSFDLESPIDSNERIATKRMNEKPQGEEQIFAGSHVLAVEDNEMNLLLMKRYLKNLGVQVSVASNGLEALTMAEETVFDAILMDIQMPGMDGYAATRQLRQMEGQNSDVPVIAVTASMMSEIQDKCNDAGMDGILLKPYVPDDLRRILIKHLRS